MLYTPFIFCPTNYLFLRKIDLSLLFNPPLLFFFLRSFGKIVEASNFRLAAEASSIAANLSLISFSF